MVVHVCGRPLTQCCPQQGLASRLDASNENATACAFTALIHAFEKYDLVWANYAETVQLNQGHICIFFTYECSYLKWIYESVVCSTMFT
jgi:hypothetical protein